MPSASPTNAATEPGELHPLLLLRLLRSAGMALFAQAALHGRLAGIEWEEEKRRLLNMLIALLSGFAFLLCLLLLFGALLLGLSWATPYRVPAMVFLVLFYATGFAIAVRRVQMLSALSGQSFAATREEIAADIALLKSRL